VNVREVASGGHLGSIFTRWPAGLDGVVAASARDC